MPLGGHLAPSHPAEERTTAGKLSKRHSHLLLFQRPAPSPPPPFFCIAHLPRAVLYAVLHRIVNDASDEERQQQETRETKSTSTTMDDSDSKQWVSSNQFNFNFHPRVRFRLFPRTVLIPLATRTWPYYAMFMFIVIAHVSSLFVLSRPHISNPSPSRLALRLIAARIPSLPAR